MQTWDVMFWLIVASKITAAIGSFFIYRHTIRHSANRLQLVLGLPLDIAAPLTNQTGAEAG